MSERKDVDPDEKATEDIPVAETTVAQPVGTQPVAKTPIMARTWSTRTLAGFAIAALVLGIGGTAAVGAISDDRGDRPRHVHGSPARVIKGIGSPALSPVGCPNRERRPRHPQIRRAEQRESLRAAPILRSA